MRRDAHRRLRSEGRARVGQDPGIRGFGNSLEGLSLLPEHIHLKSMLRAETPFILRYLPVICAKLYEKNIRGGRHWLKRLWSVNRGANCRAPGMSGNWAFSAMEGSFQGCFPLVEPRQKKPDCVGFWSGMGGTPVAARISLGSESVNALLILSRGIDRLNEAVGKLVYWLVLLAVVVSAGNATIRYLFSTSSNAWLELQWYLFSAVFLLCSGYTLYRNEHIRIDVLVSRFSERTLTYIEIIGTVLFLLPMAIFIGWLSIPLVENSYAIKEMSTDAGGLIRWPVKILIPIGFTLLSLQGISELIKRVAFLMGLIPNPVPKKVDAELELVHEIQAQHDVAKH